MPFKLSLSDSWLALRGRRSGFQYHVIVSVIRIGARLEKQAQQLLSVSNHEVLVRHHRMSLLLGVVRYPPTYT